MKVNDIEISGVITQENLNSYDLQYPRKEICETFGINFPEDMPKVETPLQVYFDTEVIENKIINTQGENKAFLHGIITTKIVYVADETSKSINTIEFYKHFSSILPINNTSNKQIATKVFIEDASVVQQDDRGFYIALLLLICPVYGEEIDKYKEVEIMPKTESINKIEKPKEENKNLTMPVKNGDMDIEIQYDMNMKGQYFEANWK